MAVSRPAERAPAAQPVRVCIVAPSLAALGGQSVQAARLTERLADVPSLAIAFLAVNPRLPGSLERLQRIKYVRTIATSAAYLASLVRELRRHDIVHAFSASYVSFLLAPLPAMLMAKLYGKRIVLNYHSGEAADHLARSRHVAVRALRLADALVVPSGYLVDAFARFGLKARAIANFVDLERIPYRERAPLRPFFLSNRNLEPLYNVACVLRAFAHIQRECPAARLTLAGDGSQRDELKTLAGTLDLRNVTFAGRIEPAEMGRVYDAADVYLNAPDIDNMPVSIIEAFAAGLPVVTTNAGGIPYMVTHGETGLMVDRGDDAAIAAASLRLLRDPELTARLVSQARAECVARYTWAAVGASWEELYLHLARGGSAGAADDPIGARAGVAREVRCAVVQR